MRPRAARDPLPPALARSGRAGPPGPTPRPDCGTRHRKFWWNRCCWNRCRWNRRSWSGCRKSSCCHRPTAPTSGAAEDGRRPGGPGRRRYSV